MSTNQERLSLAGDLRSRLARTPKERKPSTI